VSGTAGLVGLVLVGLVGLGPAGAGAGAGQGGCLACWHVVLLWALVVLVLTVCRCMSA
jgi:hypothetical protein